LEYRLSTPFQNRLVGTIIVAAAIIIFLPDVLDGKKKSNQADFDAIPKAPTFTGKMTNKTFPEEDLVLKEQSIVFNEQAKDDQLLTSNETSNTATERGNTEIVNARKAQVIPATKKN
tara:strand:+ start:4519 stop:4869 length:351 start_codon:yes stop_codon:yes gene_type:complete